MADEVGLQQSIEALSISNKNVEAALMLLAETMVEHRNTVTELIDNKKDAIKSETAQIKQPRNPINALSRNLHGLVRELKKNGSSGSSETNAIMRTLNLNMSALQDSLRAVIRSNRELADATTESGKAAKSLISGSTDESKKDRRFDRLSNADSYAFNRYLRKQPWVRMLFPGIVSRAQKFVSFSDALRGASGGAIRQGFGLGTLGKGVGAGMISSIALTGLLMAAWAVVKRNASSLVSAYQMEGRTGGTYTMNQQERFRSRAQMLGYNAEEVFKKQQEYARYGIKDTETVLSGLSAEKYFGLSNTPQFFQRLVRSTDYASKESRNLGKALFNLQSIVKTTSMGMDEVAQHQTSFMDAFRGQTTPFNYGQTTGLLENFKDLLNSYELSGQDIGSFYNASQRVDLNTLITGALFASRGGYNFKTSGGLLDQAYELRRMGSGDMVNRARVLQAELKGLYSTFGVRSFQQLSGQQKLMVTEQMMPSLLGIDVSKLPSAEKIIKTLERGTGSLSADSETLSELEEAKRTNIDTVVERMAAISDPLNSIKGLLYEWAAGGSRGAKRFVEREKSEKDKAQIKEQEDKPVINLFNYTSNPIWAAEPQVPGKGARVKINNVGR